MNTITKDKRENLIKNYFYSTEKEYDSAWNKLENSFKKISCFWKTKKTTLQILKEERSR